MQLFEFTDALFSNPKLWEDIPNGEKKKNHFMTNRLMSIQFPMQAQAFNHVKIDPVSNVDAWQKFMRKMYTKTPYWMYTKGAKKKKEEIEKKMDIKDSVIKSYSIKNRLDLKSVRDALKFYPNEMIKEIKAFEKMME